MTKLEKPFKQGPVPILELAADAEIMAAVTGIDFPPSDYSRLRTMNQEGSLA